ncbi:hypothetical protein, partial [Streptomyces melanogenes]|uniref:hypothetical protein n=1 Tax=Streptomyces melanogenes TaxID=67326 RepID=UPI00378869AC
MVPVGAFSVVVLSSAFACAVDAQALCDVGPAGGWVLALGAGLACSGERCGSQVQEFAFALDEAEVGECGELAV